MWKYIEDAGVHFDDDGDEIQVEIEFHPGPSFPLFGKLRWQR
jgi:hypothetical protein